MRAKELVEYIAKALVDEPAGVSVRPASDDPDLLELVVSGDDRGKVIGKKGRTAHAIRVLLSADKGGQAKGLDIVDA